MIVEGLAPQSIVAAVRRLRDGDLVGLPTETVYGLAANADDAAAVAKIFQAKGRPADHPLIVHVLGAAQVAHFARQVPEFAQALMRAFWPGPLTLILARRSGVAAAAAGGQDSIGLVPLASGGAGPAASLSGERSLRRRRADVGPGGPQREPVWTGQSDQRGARARRVWR